MEFESGVVKQLCIKIDIHERRYSQHPISRESYSVSGFDYAVAFHQITPCNGDQASEGGSELSAYQN